MLVRATLLRSTVRTVDPGTTCKPVRRRTVAVTDVRSLLLDTGESGVVSRERRSFSFAGGHCCTRARGLQWDGRVGATW